ncbi:hypothetical protein AB0442_35295 [Kitasatospora sp. NPDC085895]|uniref:hypothetical protein n=1 Tax=Kitasatospora sp. NPDC085895 TaxID=3155057 RepID=UPI00344F426F
MAISAQYQTSAQLAASSSPATAGIVSLCITGVGVALIAIGVSVSLSDRRQKIRSRGVQGSGYGTGDLIEGMAALAEALRDYDLGRFLVIIGALLIIVGAAIGGFAAL